MCLGMTKSIAAQEYRHVVMFQFKENALKQKVQHIESEFVALADKISEIESLEWGHNISPEGLNDGLTHCFFITFKSKKGFDVYLPHPAHKAFVEQLKPLLEKAVVLDYLAKK